MAEISASMVKELREKTGAGIKDCKEALEVNGGQVDKAADWLRQRGVSVSIRALFQTPTPAALAAAAAATAVDVPANRIPVAVTDLTPDLLPLVTLTQDELDRIVSTVDGGGANVADIYPLAPLQEGILFHHVLAERGEDAYIMSVTLEFDDRGWLDRFLDALRHVVERHDVLRTAIVWQNVREPVQVVWRAVSLPVVEVAPRPGADPVVTLAASAGLSMDLDRAPLLDVHVSPATEGPGWFALVRVHHLVQDHVAFDVLLDEVRAILAGRRDRLPAPVAFRTFVAHARGAVPAVEHERYFADRLGDVTEPTVAYGIDDVRGDGAMLSRARVGVAAETVARLRQTARDLRASPATVLHVAWARVLATIARRDDVVFGTVLFGRFNAGAGSARTPGPFINTLPVRVNVAGTRVRQAVEAMSAQLAGLLEHEHAPLALAQRASGVAPDTPLFTTLFNYRHNPTADPDAADDSGALAGIRLRHTQERSTFPVNASVDDSGEALVLTVDAVAPIDARALAELFGRTVEALLDALREALDGDTDPPLAAVEVDDAAAAGAHHWPDRPAARAHPATGAAAPSGPDADAARSGPEADAARSGPDADAARSAPDADAELVERIRGFVAHRLPAHMVPSTVVLLDAFPVTTNGKIDRRALRSRPLATVTTAASPARPPRTPREEALCAIFAEVLGRAAVEPDDDFFVLGGHSLLAVRLISRIRAQFDVDLPLRALLDGPTVTEVAARLDDAPSTRPALRRMR